MHRIGMSLFLLSAFFSVSLWADDQSKSERAAKCLAGLESTDEIAVGETVDSIRKKLLNNIEEKTEEVISEMYTTGLSSIKDPFLARGKETAFQEALVEAYAKALPSLMTRNMKNLQALSRGD